MPGNHSPSVLALWLWAGCSAISRADDIGYLEKPIVVTANRTTQTLDETLASATVITRDEIERQQARSMQDLLHGIAGVNIANNGGPGKNTTLFLRGTESDHVLVLIDGVRMGSISSGTTEIQNFPVELIERIEIVRGPRSSLYGPEAVGGVIHIFTRKGKKGLKPTFSFGGGSYGTISGSATLSEEVNAAGSIWESVDLTPMVLMPALAVLFPIAPGVLHSNRTRMAIVIFPDQSVQVTASITVWISRPVFCMLTETINSMAAS